MNLSNMNDFPSIAYGTVGRTEQTRRNPERRPPVEHKSCRKRCREGELGFALFRHSRRPWSGLPGPQCDFRLDRVSEPTTDKNVHPT